MNRREFLKDSMRAAIAVVLFPVAGECKVDGSQGIDDTVGQLADRLQESNELVAELEVEITERALEDNIWYKKYSRAQSRIEMMKRERDGRKHPS